MKILRLTERFKLNLDGVIVTIAPLSGSQKLEMTSMIRQGADGKHYIDKTKQEVFLVKHSVKAIEGLKDMDEADYALEFEKDSSYLTNECAEEVLSFLVNTMFTFANTQAMNGLFGEVINPFTNEPIKGVSIERVVKEGDEKK
jgi:hypothetical protein